MNISFSLNRADALALNEVRFDEFYQLGRSYNGIAQGQYWSTADCLNWLEKELVTYYADGNSSFDGTPRVSVRGKVFYKELLIHAGLVQSAMRHLKVRLGELHRGECSVSDVRNARKSLNSLLDRTEW